MWDLCFTLLQQHLVEQKRKKKNIDDFNDVHSVPTDYYAVTDSTHSGLVQFHRQALWAAEV